MTDGAFKESIATPESCKVATPSSLAESMVEALGDGPGCKWLDPCVGGGAFVQALTSKGVEPRRITAVDLEGDLPRSEPGVSYISGEDFIAWSGRTLRRFDRIIANPPYVALSKLHKDLQTTACSTEFPDGSLAPLGSNYWMVFLCASFRVLREGGGICFVLPASWDYADYAQSAREIIPTWFRDFQIHRSSKPIFPSVQDGCIVLIGRGFRESPKSFTRDQHTSADMLVEVLRARAGRVVVDDEGQGHHRRGLVRIPHGTQLLRDVVDIRLGGVTGDAQFFLMTEDKRMALGLPTGALRPAVSKARHLTAGELTEQVWQSLKDRGERVWLFDPPPSMLKHSAVKKYLRLAPAKGGCRRNRYKLSRVPWFRTPLPVKVDGFISGMSHDGPWISLKAMERLTASNTLYVVSFQSKLSRDEKAAWALSMMTSEVRHILDEVGREYPDGLLKYEPRDLGAVSIPIPRRTEGAADYYLEVVHALVSSSDPAESFRMADAWIGLPQHPE